MSGQHAVAVSKVGRTGKLVIITVYRPDPEKWIGWRKEEVGLCKSVTAAKGKLLKRKSVIFTSGVIR